MVNVNMETSCIGTLGRLLNQLALAKVTDPMRDVL